MQLLERIWELFGLLFGGMGRALEVGLTSLFGSSNARYLRKLQPKVAAINALEPKYQAMGDEELKRQTVEFRKRLAAGETLDDILVEAFAVCREAGRRYLGMRHYDVQLLGGMVLHSGAIAEMVTGEGKTLVATLPAYLNALAGEGVHVVTVNSYLARRDMEWMGPLYIGLGLTVGAVLSDQGGEEKQRAYNCDITYGTNNEFGFDYLRDNMRPAARGDSRYDPDMQQTQGRLNYAIIDEVDNILIDEARTPLIIAGPAHDDVTRYVKAEKIARQLRKDEHFEVKEKEHSVPLTDAGVREAERLAGVESFYTAGNMDWPHLIDNALKAHHLYKRDVNYVVQDGEIIIVDEFTGRLMPGRNWSDGLHQAVEAKEGVPVKKENQTYATITLQNFFKLYKKISGMTGTAMTEASEFWKIYKLDVVAIPTNRDMQRVNYPDVIYRTEKEKYEAIVKEIEDLNRVDMVETSDGTRIIGDVKDENDNEVTVVAEDKQTHRLPRDKVKRVYRRGRPVLVGTVSIEKSERLSAMLNRKGIKHQVLNAKHHQREAEIISQAGRLGAVTIATNMAGRGTDIILGGNPETMAWAQLQSKYETRLDVPPEEWNQLIQEIEQREKMKPEGQFVKSIGGLHIIGTERHEARRIDLQLRGRCGRQGDPGTSRFYLSLEDDLMRIFAGEWVKNVLTRLGMKEGEAIESAMVSRRIAGAQKKREEHNFDIRKNLLEYDEVMDEQRKRVYGFRQAVLEGANCKQKIMEMIESQVEDHLAEFLSPDYGVSTFAKWASSELGVEIDPRDLRGLEYEGAERIVKERASRQVLNQVHDAVEENLPPDTEEAEWNWESLAKTANVRWKLNLRDRDLKKIGRDNVAEYLIEQAEGTVEKTDLSAGAKFLESDYNRRTACDWVQHKFGIKIDPSEIESLDAQGVQQLVLSRIEKIYDQKEIEYPVMAGLLHFTRGDASGQKRFDRENLVEWARSRFDVNLDLEDLRSKQRDEIRDLLLVSSKEHHERANAAIRELQQQLERSFNGSQGSLASQPGGANGALDSLVKWVETNIAPAPTPPAEEMARLDREKLEQKLTMAVEDKFRPEIRRMERSLILQLLDTAWKEHLLTMDHLKSSVGLRGYAQVDPKVEYKREGMRIFEQMWSAVGERVTDLIFRMEQLDEGFVGSTWVDNSAVHESPPTTGDMADQQKAASGPSEEAKKEPIRNFQARVGPNEPCPCGSGKKFKKCCMGNARSA